jgi:ParB family chromosome partitioning protein
MVKRGLGRGFDALIPTDVVDSEFDVTADKDEQVSDLRTLKISDVAPDPEQPRRSFDEEQLKALARSIKEHGVLQPIVVVLNKSKTGAPYEIVAGERRWRAAGLAGLTKIPAIIRTLSAQHKLELSIIENVQRADLNPLETATAYLKLKNQFNLTDAAIAERVGKNASTISNQMRLLNLPEFAREGLITGAISEGHARQILALIGLGAPAKTVRAFYDQIGREHLSVREAESVVTDYKKTGVMATGAKQPDQNTDSPIKSANDTAGGSAAHDQTGETTANSRANAQNLAATKFHVTDFTRVLAKKLHLPDAQIQQKATARTKSGGQIVLKYKTAEELQQIIDALN